MLLAQSQGTIYSKPASSDRLRFKQKQILGAKKAMLIRGIHIGFMGGKILVLAQIT